MRILLIRHADPEYTNDTLTETGFKEAELLGEYLKDKEVGHIYVSPMGRAKKTMEPILKAKGITDYKVLDWAHEFEYEVDIDNNELSDAYIGQNIGEDGTVYPRVVWDMYPRKFTATDDYLDPVDWHNSAVAKHSKLNEGYAYVTGEFDKLLAEYGYVRNGKVYNCEQGNHETITIICHFGVKMVMMSHLINVSPFALWHGTCAAPTSITEFVSEEREKGIAYFRCLRMGSTPHLDMGNMKPGFTARFCETFEDDDRH